LKLSRNLGLVLILTLTACGSGAPTIQDAVVTSSPAEVSGTPTILPAASIENTLIQDPASTLEPLSDTSPSGDAPCLEEQGSIQLYSFPVLRTQDEISGRIYTPPCYGANLDQKYPTLYLLHGATETDSQWDDLGINEQADLLINRREISPLIIIMPKENSWIPLPENPFGKTHLVNTSSKILSPGWTHIFKLGLGERIGRLAGCPGGVTGQFGSGS